MIVIISHIFNAVYTIHEIDYGAKLQADYYHLRKHEQILR